MAIHTHEDMKLPNDVTDDRERGSEPIIHQTINYTDLYFQSKIVPSEGKRYYPKGIQG
jgi:hypothetical protein